MSLDRIDLLSNASATGSDKDIRAGRYILMVEGTFSGATVKVQLSSPQGTYLDLSGASMTAAGASAILYIPSGLAKGVITGGPPSGIYAHLIPV